MRRSVLFIIFVLMFVVYPSTVKAAFVSGVDDDVPEKHWVFTSPDKLTSPSGSTLIYNGIMEKKAGDVAKNFREIDEDGYVSALIDSPLVLKGNNINLWIENNIQKQDFYNKTSGSTIVMKIGGSSFNIYIPRGRKYDIATETYISVNSHIIRNTLQAIETYKENVKKGAVAGSVDVGYSIYTGYSDNQLLLGDGTATTVSESNGLLLQGNGGTIFGGKDSSQVNYTLDYFYNPLFGRIEKDELPKTDDDWLKKASEVVFNFSDEGVEIIVDTDFDRFIKNMQNDSIQLIKDGVPSTSKTDRIVNLNLYKTTYRAKDAMDYKMRVAVPSIFERDTNTKKFKIIKENGFVLLDGIRISAYNGKVYKDPNGDGTDLEEISTVADFGDLSGNYLALYHYKEGNNTLGVLIPLKYREAIYDHVSDTTYLTGRNIIFNNNYSNNLSFNIPNSDMMDVLTNTGGKSGAVPKNYAFPKDGDFKNPSSHISLESDTFTTFSFKYGFETTGDSLGLTIFRNNNFIQESSLIAWLESSEAKALLGEKAEELYNKIRGNITVDKEKISYADWLNIQRIKNELDSSTTGKLMSFIRVLSLLFGILLIIYSLFLILIYYFDIFNTFVDISILNIVTLGRLYPINLGEDDAYLYGTKGGVKYVNIFGVLKMTLIGVFFGSLFVTYTPILYFFYSLYQFILRVFGGV